MSGFLFYLKYIAWSQHATCSQSINSYAQSHFHGSGTDFGIKKRVSRVHPSEVRDAYLPLSEIIILFGG